MATSSQAVSKSFLRKSIDPRTAMVLAQEVEAQLHDVVRAWFPRTLDEKYGGFLCDFNYRWRPKGPQVKMLEYQARTTRFAARIATLPGLESYSDVAAHGFCYLKDVMWDHEHGGWFRMLDREGTPLEGYTKNAHGSSYAIGACAAYYELTLNQDALQLAQKGYEWLEKVAYDDVHGGYYPFYQRDGTRITDIRQNPLGNAPRDSLGVPIGLKDTNTNVDLMEAYADLYHIAPNEQLKTRFIEMLHIVRDRIVVPPGAVHLYFQPDWTPVPDFNRYPYAVNTANLLAKVAGTLPPNEKTDQVVKSLVDTLLRYSWDKRRGGFYYAGSTFGPVYVEDIKLFAKDKFWWAQAEGIRALLRLALLYPEDTINYMDRFLDLWNYIKKYIIDRRYGGWVWVGRDCFRLRPKPKATKWKDPSHEGSSLLDCLQMLKAQVRS